MPIKILHCLPAEKFTEAFIEFVLEHFDRDSHNFIVKRLTTFEVQSRPQVMLVPKQAGWLSLISAYFSLLNRADKVIIHSLFDNKLTLLLALQPWLLSKCVWVIWGGDLYNNLTPAQTQKGRLLGAFRRFVIRRIGGIVTMIDGDYELARKHFGTRAKCYASFVYPSNLVNTLQSVSNEHDGINVLVGNSADPSNHHCDVLERLAAAGHSQLNVIAPLSYGDRSYAQKVIARGKELFGNKFSALEDFIPREEYEELLKKIDIAIFNHDRQQALGNIITLLGLGKKVYIRNTVTHWDFFVGIGVAIDNVADIKITFLDAELQKKNQLIIGQYFNSANLRQQLDVIFNN